MHLELILSTGSIEHVSSLLIDKLYRLSFEDPERGITSKLDSTSVVLGNLQAPAAYEDAVRYLAGIDVGDTKRFLDLYITIPNNNYYIRFKDSIVELICLSNFSSDGIGVTKQEAALVNNLSDKFLNLNITNLEDLENFTNNTINMDGIYDISSSAISDKFGNISAWLSRTYANPYIYPTSPISIKMPRGCSINYKNSMFYSRDGRTLLNFTIDWNNSIVTCTHSNRGSTAVFRNCYLIWNDSLIPQQTQMTSMIFMSCTIDKVIFREGITNVIDNFNGVATSYIEYPSTITNVGLLFRNFRQDTRNKGIVSDTGCVVIKAVTPPTLLDMDGYYVDTARCVLPESIYVPDGSVATYKAAAGWSSSEIVDKIKAMSSMTNAERELGTVTQEDINRT